MAKKTPSSVIGVDLGRYALKSVLLQRKGGNRFVLNNYAVRVMDKAPETAEQLAAELTLLFKEMGGSPKTCAVAVSSSESLIRIIEQPETPTEILRDALRLNGMALLNQDVKEFVLDCDLIADEAAENNTQPSGAVRHLRYLVAGLPRVRVGLVDAAFQQHRKGSVHNLQLAPLCGFNAFQFSHAEIFNNEAFALVDIGHTASTVTVGAKRELVLVRAIEYGGKTLSETLVENGAPDSDEAMRLLEEGDELTIENTRLALTALVREIGSSIGFFEGRREEAIGKVFVSGGPARSKALLKILSEELQIPCESWDPFKACEVSLPAHRKPLFAEDFVSLNVACGAAAEALKGNEK